MDRFSGDREALELQLGTLEGELAVLDGDIAAFAEEEIAPGCTLRPNETSTKLRRESMITQIAATRSALEG